MSIAAANPTIYRSSLSNAANNGANNNSGGGGHLQLPKIVHSGSRIGDPTSLNITARGVSRASSLGDMVDRMHDDSMNGGRPLPYEFGDDSLMNMAAKKKSNRNSANGYGSNNNKSNINNNILSGSYQIPENIKTVYSPDITKPSMPVFGNRPDAINNTNKATSRSVPATPVFQRAEVDEIVALLKERARTSYHEIRTKFKNGDHDGKGVVSKDALAHILASILGPSRPISHQQYQKLLERLELNKKHLIKFEEFIGCFQETKSETPTWVDPVRATAPNQPSQQTFVMRKATQVYVILKEKSKLKAKEMTDLIPQLIGGNPNRIFKPELMNCINLMNIKMDNEEFDKLWRKFDEENLGVVHSDLLLKRLGLHEFASNSPRPAEKKNSIDKGGIDTGRSVPDVPLPQIPDAKVRSSSRNSNKNPIEKWLKKRFREGFSQMKHAFEEIDRSKTGHIRKDQFLAIMRKFGLKLENNLLDAFLERCEVETSNDQVFYTKFLEKFQNRSEQGLTYKMIANNYDTGRAESALGQVEKKLLRMFQRDFLSLLAIFRKIDRNRLSSISKQEFRAALESHFAIEMSDAEFEEFCKDLPIIDGRVQYLEFMARFDTEDTGSLFDSQSVQGDVSPPPPIRRKQQAEYEPIEEENEDNLTPREDFYAPTGRGLKELRELIKNYIRNSYKDLETKWSNIDESNTSEMTKEMLYQLLKGLKITPAVTRAEVDALWTEFLLKDNNKLEYWQFVRHFGYNKKSAAFTNAKRAPPKKGDSDMMLTSNKLGRDSILIRGSVHAKLRLESDNLRRNFNEIDPYRSGYVLRDEYKEILMELCPELNDDEFDVLCEKYENPFDGRINYNTFLQPYTVRIKIKKQEAGGTTGGGGGITSRSDTNDPLVQKLRYKLHDRFKELRRLFKQKDYKQTGTIPVNAFKECLDATKINLNDEEMYSLLNRLDKDMLGSVNYNKFITEFIKQ